MHKSNHFDILWFKNISKKANRQSWWWSPGVLLLKLQHYWERLTKYWPVETTTKLRKIINKVSVCWSYNIIEKDCLAKYRPVETKTLFRKIINKVQACWSYNINEKDYLQSNGLLKRQHFLKRLLTKYRPVETTTLLRKIINKVSVCWSYDIIEKDY